MQELNPAKDTASNAQIMFLVLHTLSTDKNFKTVFVIDTKFWASDVRILPQDQLVGVTVQQYDGTYSYPKPFSKLDGFYISVPTQ